MKTNSVVLITAVFMLIISVSASAALTFNLDFGRDGDYESNVNLGIGDTLWADLYVSGIETPGLISMGFELVYNKSVLSISNASVIGWDPATNSETASGWVFTGANLFDTRIGNDILLASFQIDVIGYGGTNLLNIFDTDRGGTVSDFVLSNNTVLDSQIANGVNLAQINLPNLPINIPLPNSILLLLSGLLGLLIAKGKVKLFDMEKMS